MCCFVGVRVGPTTPHSSRFFLLLPMHKLGTGWTNGARDPEARGLPVVLVRRRLGGLLVALLRAIAASEELRCKHCERPRAPRERGDPLELQFSLSSAS